MTDAEQRLWSRLRRKQILGVSFYRQKPLGNFIVDFYVPKAKLVVEVDGSQHADVDHAARDAERDKHLRAQGLRVLRFSNGQVLREVGTVMEVIYVAVVERNPPSPLFQRGVNEELTSTTQDRVLPAPIRLNPGALPFQVLKSPLWKRGEGGICPTPAPVPKD